MSGKRAVPEDLELFFESHPRPALAFSGGADSSYLLYAAVACGADVTPYLVKSQFQALTELENAERTANELGVDLHIILTNILSDENIRSNPPDRCYTCKKRIFSIISEHAASDKKGCVIDATNASDDPTARPGMKALTEMGILSPLRECGLSKTDVRRLSKEADLWTWDLPSNSCLATRVAAGIELNDVLLANTEDIESTLSDMGFCSFRLRTTTEGALLETQGSQSQLLDEKRSEIEEILLKYYPTVAYHTRPPQP